MDRFNTSKNPDPNSSVNELIQIRDFFTIKGGGLFVRFSSSNESHLIISELYNEGEVYSPNYSNLDCGELTKVDASIKKAQSFRCTGTSNQGWIEVSVNKGNKLSSIELSLLLGPNVGVRGQWLAEKDFCEQSPEASSSNRCPFDTTNMPPSDHLYNALMRNSYQNVVNAVERGAIKMWDYKMPIMNICAMSCQDERIVAYLSQQPEDLESINHTEYLIQKFSPPDIILLESLKKINQISRDCKKSKWSQFGDREEKSCTKKVKSELEKSIAIIKGELDRRGISH